MKRRLGWLVAISFLLILWSVPSFAETGKDETAWEEWLREHPDWRDHPEWPVPIGVQEPVGEQKALEKGELPGERWWEERQREWQRRHPDSKYFPTGVREPIGSEKVKTEEEKEKAEEQQREQRLKELEEEKQRLIREQRKERFHIALEFLGKAEEVFPAPESLAKAIFNWIRDVLIMRGTIPDFKPYDHGTREYELTEKIRKINKEIEGIKKGKEKKEEKKEEGEKEKKNPLSFDSSYTDDEEEWEDIDWEDIDWDEDLDDIDLDDIDWDELED